MRVRLGTGVPSRRGAAGFALSLWPPPLPPLVALLLLMAPVHAIERNAAPRDAAPLASRTFRDDLGREVPLAQPPQRIVSLLPSITETLCALDACERIVATDQFSDWPASVRSLPKVGGLEDAEIETIVRLKPDVVLLSRTQRITERLAQLGIPSFALNSETYVSIAHTVDVLGAVLGEPARAAQLERKIGSAVDTIGAQARARRRGPAPTVYFEADRTPYAAGPNSFIGELLTRLGAHNIVSADLGPFPRLNPEYIVRHDPDIIIVDAGDAPHLAERPGWDRLRAVRERHLCSLTQAVRDTVVRPGPRVGEGMQALADCLARWAP
jgi:iron complex transport system substrate-binding protein